MFKNQEDLDSPRLEDFSNGSDKEKNKIKEKVKEKIIIPKQIQKIPTELLRYRKDNGRITSDVLDYQQNNIRLDEKKRDDQKIIKGFLYNKDPKTTQVRPKRTGPVPTPRQPYLGTH